MINLNRATIIGNCTRDPEMRYIPSGQGVTSFSVATNRRWTKDGEDREETEFHNVVAWGKLAEIAHQILKKGGKVYVEGRLQTRSWEGQDGVTRQRTEIIAENLISLSPKGTVSSSEVSKETAPQPKPEKPEAPKKDEKKSGSPAERGQPKAEKTKEETEKKSDKKKDEEEIDIDDIPF